MTFQACPDFKGIKTAVIIVVKLVKPFQACPDFKGIKTVACFNVFGLCRFQACPDFKGIKTRLGFCNAFGFIVSSLP